MKVGTHLSISRTLKETLECTRAIRNTHFLIDSKTFLGLPLQKEKKNIGRIHKKFRQGEDRLKSRCLTLKSKCLRNEPGLHIFSSNWLTVK